MDTVGALRLGNQGPALIQARCHGFFTEDMAPVLKSGAHNICPRSRDNNVEQKVGFGFGKNGVKVAANDSLAQTELGSTGFGCWQMNIGKADDLNFALEQGMCSYRLKPAFGHAAAPGEHRTKNHEVLPRTCADAGYCGLSSAVP
jgi:hypothetical protein